MEIWYENCENLKWKESSWRWWRKKKIFHIISGLLLIFFFSPLRSFSFQRWRRRARKVNLCWYYITQHISSVVCIMVWWKAARSKEKVPLFSPDCCLLLWSFTACECETVKRKALASTSIRGENGNVLVFLLLCHFILALVECRVESWTNTNARGRRIECCWENHEKVDVENVISCIECVRMRRKRVENENQICKLFNLDC